MVCGTQLPTTMSVYEQQRCLHGNRTNQECSVAWSLNYIKETKSASSPVYASSESDSTNDDFSDSVSDLGSPVMRTRTHSAYNEDCAFEIVCDSVDDSAFSNCYWLTPTVTTYTQYARADSSFVSMQMPETHAIQGACSRVQDVIPSPALLEMLEMGGSALKEVVANIRGRVQDLSFDAVGCRVVQLAVKVVDMETAAELVSELQGCVIDASRSPSANYVLQRIIEVLPNAITSFVAEELTSIACEAAQHRFGCRVLSRLLELSANHPSVLRLASELVKDTLTLSRHEYGHYVMQALVQHGSHKHQQQIANAFAAAFAFHVEDGSSSYVLESIFLHCSDDVLESLMRLLVSGGSFNVEACTRSVCGIRVLRAAVKSQGARKQQLLQSVMALAPQIRQCSQGHRLLQEVKQAKKQKGGKPNF